MADDLVLDLTNYKDTVGGYVAPGRYTCVIEDAELGESSQKKTPQLTVWLRVVGGPFDGVTLVEALYLTDASKFRVVGFLQALKIKTPKAKITLKLAAFLNRRIVVTVEDDTYNGRTRSRVSSFERFEAEEAGGEANGLDEFAGATAAAPVVAETQAAPAPVEAAPAAEAPKTSEIGNRTESEIAPSAPAAAPAETPAPAPAEASEDGDDEGIDLDDLNL